MHIVISSGHGKYVPGASGYLDEVTEARRVVDKVAQWLTIAGHKVTVFHDNTSTSKSENLDTIVEFHNDQGPHDLDVSVHFNAYVTTDEPQGTEVLYLTQLDLAERLSAAIANAGSFKDRGPKKRTDLAFLNGTNAPAILIETCFVDSSVDARNYELYFDDICEAIGMFGTKKPPAVAHFEGKCSHFGGPNDMGVSPDEGLAFIYDYDMAPHLFLDEQPPGTTGLARRLDPEIYYIACRWDYDVTPKSMLVDKNLYAEVRAPSTGKAMLVWPADWGPHQDTGRAADLSPGLMTYLGIGTDDEVQVDYPIGKSWK